MNALVDGKSYKFYFKYWENGEGKKFRKGTNCVIELPDDNTAYVGISICAPMDNFDKSVGRKLSFTRAVSCIEDKHIRTVLWENFRREVKAS